MYLSGIKNNTESHHILSISNYYIFRSLNIIFYEDQHNDQISKFMSMALIIINIILRFIYK